MTINFDMFVFVVIVFVTIGLVAWDEYKEYKGRKK